MLPIPPCPSRLFSRTFCPTIVPGLRGISPGELIIPACQRTQTSETSPERQRREAGHPRRVDARLFLIRAIGKNQIRADASPNHAHREGDRVDRSERLLLVDLVEAILAALILLRALVLDVLMVLVKDERSDT